MHGTVKGKGDRCAHHVQHVMMRHASNTICNWAVLPESSLICLIKAFFSWCGQRDWLVHTWSLSTTLKRQSNTLERRLITPWRQLMAEAQEDVASIFNAQPHVNDLTSGIEATPQHCSKQYTFMLKHKHFDLSPGEVLWIREVPNGYDTTVTERKKFGTLYGSMHVDFRKYMDSFWVHTERSWILGYSWAAKGGF